MKLPEPTGWEARSAHETDRSGALDRDGHLFIEDVACDELARRFGTPIFVTSEDQLRRNARCFTPSVPLPHVKDGEVLAFLDTGAYQDASATNVNALPRPATVLVCGSEAELIKRAETVADVFARDVVPSRLAGVP